MQLPEWLTEKNQVNKVAHWVSCPVSEICKAGSRYQKDKSLYRIGPNELSNWADRYDLACGSNKQAEHYFKIALLGGCLLATLFVPTIADKYGRKTIFCLSFMVSLLAQFGLLISESYDHALILLTLMGLVWPGKLLVGLQYILDFFPASSHRAYVFVFLFLSGILSCFIPIYYGVISKDYYPL